MALLVAFILVAPLILVIPIVEICGLIGLQSRAASNEHGLQSRRFATLNSAGEFTLWPENTRAISNYSEGVAPYFESSREEVPHHYESMDLPLINYALPASGGFVDLAGHKIPLRKWRVGATTRLSNGLAPVQDPFTEQYCFVDINGVQKLPQSYKMARPFSDGRAAVLVESPDKDEKGEKSKKWGFIGIDGKMALSPRFGAVSDFIDGRALVREAGDSDKILVIDRSGKSLSEFSMSELMPLASNGRSAFNYRGKGWRRFQLPVPDSSRLSEMILFENASLGSGVAIWNDGACLADNVGKKILDATYEAFLKSTKPGEHLRKSSDELYSVSREPIRVSSGKYTISVPRLEFINKKGQVIKLPDRVIVAAYPFKDGVTVVKTFLPYEE